MLSRTLLLAAAISAAALAPAVAVAQEPPTVQLRALSARVANQIALAAQQECSRRGYQVAAAVVGRDGRLLSFVRDPLAGPHTIEVSQRKAFAAATYQTPTTALMTREDLRFTPGVILIGGGLPINLGGHFYGAVGVSGAPATRVAGDVDELCARAGIEAVREELEFGG